MSSSRTVRDALVAGLQELALASAVAYLSFSWLDTLVEGWATLFTSVTAWLGLAIAAAALAHWLGRGTATRPSLGRAGQFVWPAVAGGVTVLLLRTSFWQDPLPSAVVWGSAAFALLATWFSLRVSRQRSSHV